MAWMAHREVRARDATRRYAPRRDPPLLHGTRRDLSTRTIGATATDARSRNTAGRIPAAAFVKRVARVRFC
jgi:hypothetical protein